jgi:hypothetical protein
MAAARQQGGGSVPKLIDNDFDVRVGRFNIPPAGQLSQAPGRQKQIAVALGGLAGLCSLGYGR